MNAIATPPITQSDLVEPVQRLEWVSRHVLRGANVHHGQTVVCVQVRLGRWRGRLTSDLPASFTNECIKRLLAGAKAPPNGPQVQVLESLLRTGEPIPLEQLMLECLLVLERHLAVERLDFRPIEKAEVRDLDGKGEVELIWSSHEPVLSIAASRVVVAEFDRMLGCVEGNEPPTEELDAQRAKLIERSQRRLTPITTSALMLAAHSRGLYADMRGGPTVQFGQGALQRLAHSTVLEGETMASARLARHKARTARTLTKLGLPAPRQSVVHSLEEAMTAAQHIGFPVVVKPLRGKGGSGVSVGVRSADELSSAAERARDAKGSYLVEEMVSGTTFRLLVIDGHFSCALRLDQPRVRGDGRRTIRELVDALNADPVRDFIRLTQVKTDAGFLQCVAAQGYTPDSVPAMGKTVILRSAANIGSGSTHTDVTDLVHHTHAELAERATAALGLRTAGVDVVSLDIAQPVQAAHSCIVEVNARPGLHTHMFPFRGQARPAADRVLDTIFPPPASGRIPTALVLGRRAGLAAADAIASELRLRNVVVGVATRQRSSIAGVRLDDDDLTLHEAVVRMWRDPRVEALVVAVDPHRAVATGLGIETADVLCLLPPDDAEDPEAYAQAVALAASACRVVIAPPGHEGVITALEAAVRRGNLSRDAINWFGNDADRAEIAGAVGKLLYA